MKKSELRQIIREELQSLTEGKASPKAFHDILGVYMNDRWTTGTSKDRQDALKNLRVLKTKRVGDGIQYNLETVVNAGDDTEQVHWFTVTIDEDWSQ